MANVADYPINFPYGATSSPYSPSRPHRGDDRAAPSGTPVVVAGVQIGVVGATGLATGPHLHLQEWQGTPANVRRPQNSFKGGKVVAATQSGDFGNYVTIQTSDGWNDTYAHLSRIDVKVGDTIGGNDMTREQAYEISLLARIGIDFVTEAEAKTHAEDDANHILADPGYAGALMRQLKAGQNWAKASDWFSHGDKYLKDSYNKGLADAGGSGTTLAPGKYIVKG